MQTFTSHLRNRLEDYDLILARNKVLGQGQLMGTNFFFFGEPDSCLDAKNKKNKKDKK